MFTVTGLITLMIVCFSIMGYCEYKQCQYCKQFKDKINRSKNLKTN